MLHTRHSFAPVAAVLVTLLATGCGADPATDPVDDDQVDRQPLVAEPDLVAVGTGAGFTGWGDPVEWDPEQALLIGPSLTFAFDALITTAQIDAAPAAALELYDAPTATPLAAEHGLVAADGHEFLVLRTAKVTEARAGLPTVAPDRATTAIRVGDRTRMLDLAPFDSAISGDHVLVVSVPVGDDAALVLTEEGREQTLDLRTGRRGEEVSLLYQRPTVTVSGEFDSWVRSQGVTLYNPLSPGEVPLRGEVDDAALLAYHPQTGWAEVGRAWLTLWLDLDELLDPLAKITLAAQESFTLTDAAGRTTAAQPGEVTVRPLLSSNPSSGVLLFEVPEEFRSGTVRFTPTGTVTTIEDGEERSGQVHSISVGPPVSVQVERQ